MALTEAFARTVGRIAAAALLVVFLPFMAVISAAILLAMGGPVIFRHRRIGLHGKPFTFYKFRTMTAELGPDGRLLPDAARLTSLGLFLRKTSLDELPQLWNILLGDMSFVGPRPLLPQYLSRYSEHQMRRHEVRPGITGFAQIHGRNAIAWEQKFDRDVWYVDHRSLCLDLQIVWLTVCRVLRRDGISRQGHATMPEFLGANGLEK